MAETINSALGNIVLALICLATLTANAQVTGTVKKSSVDSVKKDITSIPDRVKQLHSKSWSDILPVAMVTYGILSLAIPAGSSYRF